MIAAIALDLGSTAIKAGLLDQHGNLGSIVSQPAPPVTAEGGQYECDALSYAEVAEQVLKTCLAQTDELPPLGLCSQRSSFLIWEQASGKPVTPMYSWQDTRGAESCIALQAQEPLITGLTGLRLTPYFFATKLRVLLQKNPAWLEKLQRGVWLVGTLDTFLIWRWSSGKHHLTDVSMAARTLLMDIHQQRWSPVLGDVFDIPLDILPAIKPSTGLNIRLNNGLTLQASLADQSAALVASVGEDRETALVNLGTGGFVIRYLGDDQRNSPAGYLHTLVYQDAAPRAHIAIEGTLNSIAAALAPYPVRDCKVEELATEEDIFCLAEPSGVGAPYFRNDLGFRNDPGFRTDIGLPFSKSVAQLTQQQIACLLLEAIIFRVVRIMEEFHQSAPIRRVYLSGGLSELVTMQQGIAQCLSQPVFRLQQKDASLQGAALLAAGIKHAPQQDAVLIQASSKNQALLQKYLRWKQWFDSLLLES